MFNMREVERRCVREVGRARGCEVEESTDRWPDGWLVEKAGRRIPVEVVCAFPCSNGTKWAAAHAGAASEARRLDPPVSFHVDRHGNATVLRDGVKLPLATKPVDNAPGIAAAIKKKADKYGPNEVRSAVLVVHNVQEMAPLSEHELNSVAEYARQHDVAFSEIWVVNEYGDPAQRVPFAPRAPASD